MIVIPPVGSICLVTSDIYPKHSMKIKIIDLDVKDNSLGTIKYQVLCKTNKRDGYKQETIESYKTSHKYDYKAGRYIRIPYFYDRPFRDEKGNYVIVEDMHVENEYFTDVFSVVENLWFDEELTGRKVTIINSKLLNQEGNIPISTV